MKLHLSGLPPRADSTRVTCLPAWSSRAGRLIHHAQQHGHGPIAGTTRPNNGQIRIEVRDHGPGFPPDCLPHSFDRFTQADRARTTMGTGLGLAITSAEPSGRRSEPAPGIRRPAVACPGRARPGRTSASVHGLLAGHVGAWRRTKADGTA